MDEITDRIREIEEEFAGLPTGYISKKVIGGKERFYLQWLENGKLKSKYIKTSEFASISAQVERRKTLQEELRQHRTIDFAGCVFHGSNVQC